MDEQQLKPVKVTVGVCGGIAAYKAVDLVRLLQDAGLDPHVIMTASAQQFVTPLTFSAISGHPVITGMFGGTDEAPKQDPTIEHIAEAQSTSALVVAPATASTLAKLAQGIADDFLSTLYLATTAPVIIAPAMNVNMWNHPATQANLAILRDRGVQIVEPGSGYLACGMTGSGRLAEVPTIVSATLKAIEDHAPRHADLTGQTVLITAGGTREAIDPVRFIGNRSSGRMGIALAAAAARRGAEVTLVAANVALPEPAGVRRLDVETAAQLTAAANAEFPATHVLLMAAAPADFRPTAAAPGKLEREDALDLHLEPTEDILAALAAARTPSQTIVGFAAEHGGEAAGRARDKLTRKGADLIVLNDVSDPTIGFESEQNAVTLIDKDSDTAVPTASKDAIAESILDKVDQLRPERSLQER
ncbi:MAG TPA: bifunctional phosphopantothenoylcysteine decarboxylase/phosphopantothenate--cysteine ligase CoaBC [Solirubrobacterales bacterium]